MRYILVLMSILVLVGCQQNEVETLNKAAKACVNKTTEKCVNLKRNIQNLHDLAMDLQASPQGFGQSVLKLQGQILAIEKTLKEQKTPTSRLTALKSDLKRLKENYQARLTVIRWLEAPDA